MRLFGSARAYPIYHAKLVRLPELGLNPAQRDVNHIRKSESFGIQKILKRLSSSEGKTEISIESSDDLDRHYIQVSEKFLYQRLQVCINKKDLELGRQVYAFIKTCGQHLNAFLGS
eukprot:c44229_g1_i1 orf=229-576(+)